MPATQGVSGKTVLIVSTSWWAFPARIAMAFAALGWSVDAICGHGHPLSKTRAVRHIYHYRALASVRGLRDAIERARPDLVVPCDDRSAPGHAVRADGPPSGFAAGVIARSLGRPELFAQAGSRSALIGLAREAGVRAPETVAVRSVEELRAATERLGLPAMLKVDGTWGGLGVASVETAADAVAIFHKMSRKLSAWRAWKRLLVNRDPFSIAPWLAGGRPTVNVQAYVRGRPANCLVACFEGQVIAGIHVEVLRAQHAMGAATVVRVIDHPEMAEAARRVVERLGLSGFCGLDFVIEDATGAAHLIEMNQRMTPLGHLALSGTRNPIGALSALLTGAPAVAPSLTTTNDLVAFFPQAWLLEPNSPYLNLCYHDVPWTEPDLVRELVRLPWPERSLLARLTERMRGKGEVPSRWTAPADPATPSAAPGLIAVQGMADAPVAVPAPAAMTVTGTNRLRAAHHAGLGVSLGAPMGGSSMPTV
jgi:hypothetical protein